MNGIKSEVKWKMTWAQYFIAVGVFFSLAVFFVFHCFYPYFNLLFCLQFDAHSIYEYTIIPVSVWLIATKNLFSIETTTTKREKKSNETA